MDSTRLLSLGWKPRIALREGIRQTYGWYVGEGPGAGK
jgi:GDP-L-fucose synthase